MDPGDGIDWNDLSKNTVRALKFACQQNQVHIEGRATKDDLIKALTEVRSKKLGPLPSHKTEIHLPSRTPSRETSPISNQYQRQQIFTPRPEVGAVSPRFTYARPLEIDTSMKVEQEHKKTMTRDLKIALLIFIFLCVILIALLLV